MYRKKLKQEKKSSFSEQQIYIYIYIKLKIRNNSQKKNNRTFYKIQKLKNQSHSPPKKEIHCTKRIQNVLNECAL